MNELSIDLQPESGRHLYEQIYDYIRTEIKEGKLLAGEKLPSTRSLAEYLQVARSTVDLAYAQLVSEGYLESRPCKGYFVCKTTDLYRLEALKAPVGNPGDLTKMQETTKETQDMIHFSPNDVDMRYFPFNLWRKINKETLIDDRKEMFALGNPQGDIALRETICRYLHASRGVNCRAEQIVVGAGNDYLLMLLRQVLGENVHIAMENPTYPKAYHIFQAFGYQISLVGMDRSGIRADELKASGARIAYVMPSRQFPTGVVMPIGRRMELLSWAQEEAGRYLIEDDYDSEFRYKGKPIPSLQSSDQGGRVIYMGTFSKSIAPAIRISYMVLPEALLTVYRQRGALFSSTVSRIDQTVLNAFLESGVFERHLNKMRKVYKTKHDLLLTELKPFRKRFWISGEHAGLHLLLRDKTGRNETKLLASAMEAGVRVEGLSTAYVEQKETGRLQSTVLLGYAGLGEEEIVKGVALLKQAWLG